MGLKPRTIAPLLDVGRQVIDGKAGDAFERRIDLISQGQAAGRDRLRSARIHCSPSQSLRRELDAVGRYGSVLCRLDHEGIHRCVILRLSRSSSDSSISIENTGDS